MKRRAFIASTGAAALAVALGRPPRALAQPTGWTWNNPFENGGRANAIVADPNTAHHACLMGDTWGGPHESTDGGTWQPRMGGVQNGLNGVYGRTVYPSISEAGTFYLGVGELKTTGGEFHALTPAGLDIRSNLGFSDNAPSGAAGTMPRTGCGRLITSLIDSATGKEFIYALIHAGLYESQDLGHTWTKVASDPNGGSFQKAVCAFGSGTIFCASYSADQSTPSTFWKYVRSTKATTVFTPNGVVNDLQKRATTPMVAALGSSIAKWDSTNSVWVPLFTDSTVTFASVDIVSGGLIVGITSQSPSGATKHVIVSRDNGVTWTWATTGSNVVMQSIGSPNPYPLAFAHNSLGGTMFQGAMVSIDQQDTNYWYIAGTGGAWVTQDGGTTFHPMGVGAGGGTPKGSAVLHLDNSTGGVTVNDTDWGGWTTTNNFQSYVNKPNPGTMTANNVKRTTPLGTLDASNAGKITLGIYGDIGDPYYQQAAWNVIDVQMGADNYIYASLKAGNVLVGTPH